MKNNATLTVYWKHGTQDILESAEPQPVIDFYLLPGAGIAYFCYLTIEKAKESFIKEMKLEDVRDHVGFVEMETAEKDHIKNIQEFADKHNVVFDKEGECGFGRECVGLLVGDKFVEYNPIDLVEYNPIPGFQNSKLDEICPDDAYHKHQCFAVLGRGDDAIRQLSQWVDSLKELGVELREFSTGASGVQAMFSGSKGHAFVVV